MDSAFKFSNWDNTKGVSRPKRTRTQTLWRSLKPNKDKLVLNQLSTRCDSVSNRFSEVIESVPCLETARGRWETSKAQIEQEEALNRRNKKRDLHLKQRQDEERLLRVCKAWTAISFVSATIITFIAIYRSAVLG
jgi:hypothetical protein